MPSTRTPGITVDSNGNRTINKEYRGTRLFLRFGALSQDDVEQRLRSEIERIDIELEHKAHSRPLFRHCAMRYLAQSRHRRSIKLITWHVNLLVAHLGDLEP